MHALYIFSVWLHILAAAAWVGGILFIVLVVVPWLRCSPNVDASAFLAETGTRFRSVGWACFGILLVTGTFNLWSRGVGVSDFTDSEWLSSPFGKIVVFKLGIFALMIAVSAWHDFAIGPKAVAALKKDPEAPITKILRRRASLLGRINGLFALLLVFAGVALVRGLPW